MPKGVGHFEYTLRVASPMSASYCDAERRWAPLADSLLRGFLGCELL